MRLLRRLRAPRLLLALRYVEVQGIKIKSSVDVKKKKTACDFASSLFFVWRTMFAFVIYATRRSAYVN